MSYKKWLAPAVALLALLIAPHGLPGAWTDWIPSGTRETLSGIQQDMLLQAQDVLALPDEEVTLEARLLQEPDFAARPGVTAQFLRDGTVFASQVTGTDGYARAKFKPPKAGDYLFTVRSDQREATLLVAVREAKTPITVIDMDDTLVASGFAKVIFGEPAMMPGSVDVVKRLAKDYTIIYLTHRPEYFAARSKVWLKKHEYPQGPVLTSTISGFLKGSGEFKSTKLRELSQKFKNLKIGIGDKMSDAQAYHANGMRAILILPVKADAKPKDLIELAARLDGLSDDVDVVRNWQQVQAAIYENKRFPPKQAADDLMRMVPARNDSQ